MLSLRERLCFELSRRLMTPPDQRQSNMNTYLDWREDSLRASWARFSDADVIGRDLLDFGCGYGNLSFFLAKKGARRVVGIDLGPEAIESNRRRIPEVPLPPGTSIEFVVGKIDGIPLPDQNFDTITAFDCLEHVMSPERVLKDWFRVLRPGGKVLIEWFPFRGPWGPHMEALIPVPWAHVVFGERAMFRAAQRIYELPEFQPRAWDVDAAGQKLPNKWLAWESFKEQGYVNQLSVDGFGTLAEGTGFLVPRFEAHGFSSAPARKVVSQALLNLPKVGEYFTSYVLVELQRP